MIALVRLAAIMVNRFGGGNYPESCYSIRFESIPKSADERKADRENIVELMGAGLMDKVSAYQMLNPGTSKEAAVAALDEIRTTNLKFA